MRRRGAAGRLLRAAGRASKRAGAWGQRSARRPPRRGPRCRQRQLACEPPPRRGAGGGARAGAAAGSPLVAQAGLGVSLFTLTRPPARRCRSRGRLRKCWQAARWRGCVAHAFARDSRLCDSGSDSLADTQRKREREHAEHGSQRHHGVAERACTAARAALGVPHSWINPTQRPRGAERSRRTSELEESKKKGPALERTSPLPSPRRCTRRALVGTRAGAAERARGRSGAACASVASVVRPWGP